MNPKLIVIDGKTYRNVEEMPEEVRRQYEEAMRNLSLDRINKPSQENLDPFATQPSNNNVITDFFGNQLVIGDPASVMNSSKFVVDGQTYDTLDQLPPEVRARYQQAMGKLDANQNGIPDFVEGLLSMNASAQSPAVSAQMGSAAQTPAQPGYSMPASPKISTSTIEPESSTNWLLILAGIALLGLCFVAALAGVWYFFLR